LARYLVRYSVRYLLRYYRDLPALIRAISSQIPGENDCALELRGRSIVHRPKVLPEYLASQADTARISGWLHLVVGDVEIP